MTPISYSCEHFFQVGLRRLPTPQNPHATAVDDCTICLEGIHPRAEQAVRIRACGHSFHMDCLRAWLQPLQIGQNSCPNCRLELFPALRWDDFTTTEEISYRIDTLAVRLHSNPFWGDVPVAASLTPPTISADMAMVHFVALTGLFRKYQNMLTGGSRIIPKTSSVSRLLLKRRFLGPSRRLHGESRRGVAYDDTSPGHEQTQCLQDRVTAYTLASGNSTRCRQ